MYTQAQLDTAFDLVADPADWRAPIDYTGRISMAGLNLVDKAIAHFTGTTMTMVLKETGTGSAAHLWHITATGYRNGPCGP